VNNIGRLCNDLNLLPLPSDGYYYYPKGVANILSLAMIAEEKRVVMDTAIDNAFYVFNEDGTYIRFSRTSNGMYCIDINTDKDDHVVMAHQTVKGESAHFSAIDCRRAAKVRDLQEVLACPSDVDHANDVEHNVIGNNPFTRRDIRIAKQIFGPDVPAMKGKTVKNKSKMPREDDISDIPSNIIKEYSKIHLSIDVIQQHNSNDEPPPEIIDNQTRSGKGNNPVVALANAAQPKQECVHNNNNKKTIHNRRRIRPDRRRS
jgi:hypothetical protein